jgi:hypothetical protein
MVSGQILSDTFPTYVAAPTVPGKQRQRVDYFHQCGPEPRPAQTHLPLILVTVAARNTTIRAHHRTETRLGCGAAPNLRGEV